MLLLSQVQDRPSTAVPVLNRERRRQRCPVLRCAGRLGKLQLVPADRGVAAVDRPSEVRLMVGVVIAFVVVFGPVDVRLALRIIGELFVGDSRVRRIDSESSCQSAQVILLFDQYATETFGNGKLI